MQSLVWVFYQQQEMGTEKLGATRTMMLMTIENRSSSSSIERERGKK